MYLGYRQFKYLETLSAFVVSTLKDQSKQQLNQGVNILLLVTKIMKVVQPARHIREFVTATAWTGAVLLSCNK